ncbi:hypothetical protein FIU94_18590 (plasmid) [Sulfitobacter sp. THAF37]|nr:hypothetical protein [Sulfitobacter sp. THAF37]QFT60848.1 hypothetical protein FIU94_18590 [Sulfitobacter sp. THAF37]
MTLHHATDLPTHRTAALAQSYGPFRVIPDHIATGAITAPTPWQERSA